jgi:hypothetical protein
MEMGLKFVWGKRLEIGPEMGNMGSPIWQVCFSTSTTIDCLMKARYTGLGIVPSPAPDKK